MRRGYGIRIAVGSQLNGYLEELLLAKYDKLFPVNADFTGILSDVGTIIGGATPSKKRSEYYCSNGIGWITPRDLSNTSDKFIAHGTDDITDEGYASCSAKLLPKGSVLFSSRAPIGYIAIAADAVTTNQGFKSIVPKKEIGTAFVYCFLVRNKQRIADMGAGTTFPEVSGKMMKSIELAIPEQALCSEFDFFAGPILKQQEALERENRELAALRDALLPKLMSGEIDVSQVNLTQLNSHLLHYVQRAVHTVAIVLDERNSVETVINTVLSEMQGLLDPHQLKHLTITLRRALGPKQTEPGQDLLALFLTAKEVEGCSPKTIAYYETTLRHMNTALAKSYTQVESDDLRRYLNDCEMTRGSSKVTIDNIRRIMSSFFSWLEDEDYIVKSPVRRIRRVKTAQVTKEVLSDEELEVLRDACESKRDLAIVDLLASTGMRIGELVRLDRKDVNLHERECLVMGKGNKQRPVYFDARAKLHLTEYLSSRADKSPALFVALDSSARRITVGSIELRLRDLGRSAGINRVHPHKFRRTLATHAIDKGMPIEQVQKLLGHAKIDTTMYYAMVNQSNVKASHRKYLE